MALQKQPVNIPFAEGVDTKSDPFQIPIGKFASLKNKVFNKANRLDKRNGFAALTALSDSSNKFVTTFNGNLTAVGTSINAYSSGSLSWVNKGSIGPITLDVLPMIRNSTSQTSLDAAVHSNGLVCTVYTDAVPGGTLYRYAVADSETGQNIVAPTTLVSADGPPKVFALANYFVVVYPVAANLRYVAINASAPSTVTSPTAITTVYAPTGANPAWDGVVANNKLFISYNATDGGGAVRSTYLNQTLTQGGTLVMAPGAIDFFNLCADITTPTPVIYGVGYVGGGTYFFIYDFNLAELHIPFIIEPITAKNITASAQNGVATVFYEVDNNYSYDSSIPTHYVKKTTITQAGTVGAKTVIRRSVGLASKSFIFNSNIFFLATYQSSYQPTYFLLNSSGTVISKLAYSNGAGYVTTGLPSVSVDEDAEVAHVPYLIKDLLIPVNKTQAATTSAGVYAQTGINLASFGFNADSFNSVEIGNNLELSGGFVWGYDGYVAVEQGFHIWPDNVECVWAATGGHISAQPDGATNTNAYYYVALYEWTDNQGNIYRSAPSVPVGVTTTGNGIIGAITVNVPYLRLTAKTANPVKIVIYRWSVAQQIYYQVTSVSSPQLNVTTSDSLAFSDTLADSSIVGNSILYTTGNVLENIGAPATSAMALYRSRLFLIDAEDKNLLWFSKQVIEGTPVEMSDLLTLFVAPTTAAQGTTGPLKCLAPMDDKLILFKKNALYYLVGNGPDNTGASNDFSEPVFITSTIGCENQRSIVFQPMGLMFESDKGIWILKRDLSTEYIGAPVEDYTTDATVLSSVNVPGTNQVRFVLDSGITLMYDYFFGQWCVFEGLNAISSTIFEGLHTYIDQYGRVFQESPGLYLDGSRPVLISLKTGWINVAGLQGYERAYFFYLLGEYKSPHKLQIDVAYDYNSSPIQSSIITPINFNPRYGDSDGAYGDESPCGGNGTAEKWRIFLKKQKCEAFQITITEIYDPSYGVAAGAGLTLSGLNLIVGVKSGYPRRSAQTSVG